MQSEIACGWQAQTPSTFSFNGETRLQNYEVKCTQTDLI